MCGFTDALNCPKRNVEGPLRLSVSDVYKVRSLHLYFLITDFIVAVGMKSSSPLCNRDKVLRRLLLGMFFQESCCLGWKLSSCRVAMLESSRVRELPVLS